MNKEEMKIKEFDKEQLKLLLNDLQDIDKFNGFKDGAFKYELGKYQANLLVDYIKKQEEVIDKTMDIINDYLKEDYSIYTENEIEVDLIVKLKNILKEASKWK